MTTTTKSDNNTRAVGRRKTASARVRITIPGKGEISINDRPFEKYFGHKLWRDTVRSPLVAIGRDKDLDISVKVAGGGIAAQAEAVRHGIARALIKWNADYRATLKAAGFLTRDPREKERKKFGLHKARRAHQWRKR